MSTLEGAVPLGLGITKLRLWDELHRAHCETMHPESHAFSSLATRGNSYTDSHTVLNPSQPHLNESPPSTTRHPGKSHTSPPNPAKKRRTDPPESSQQVNLPTNSARFEPVSGQIVYRDPQTPFSDWFKLDHRGDSCSRADDAASTSSNDMVAPKDSQGILMPPPPPLPGPSRRRPPPLVARIKAKARRAKRKQQKAEYRRSLFLAHLVQVTSQARQRNAQHLGGSASSTRAATSGKVSVSAPTSAVKITKTSTAQQAIQQAWLLFPECLGVDLGSFVEIVFDTDAQSSEITAPSDISDDELSQATKVEIDNRKRLGGADVQVPKGVFRWMVARDLAERWPQKVQHVRDNPWPGLEHLWGSPSSSSVPEGSAGNKIDAKGRARAGQRDDEPIRWQSGRRSRFIRKKEPKGPERRAGLEEDVEGHQLGISTSMKRSSGASSSSHAAMREFKMDTSAQASMEGMASFQAKDFRVMHGTLPAFERTLDTCSEHKTAISRQRADSFDYPRLTFDTTTGSWARTSVTSCSHAATAPSSAAGVPIRL